MRRYRWLQGGAALCAALSILPVKAQDGEDELPPVLRFARDWRDAPSPAEPVRQSASRHNQVKKPRYPAAKKGPADTDLTQKITSKSSGKMTAENSCGPELSPLPVIYPTSHNLHSRGIVDTDPRRELTAGEKGRLGDDASIGTALSVLTLLSEFNKKTDLSALRLLEHQVAQARAEVVKAQAQSVHLRQEIMQNAAIDSLQSEQRREIGSTARSLADKARAWLQEKGGIKKYIEMCLAGGERQHQQLEEIAKLNEVTEKRMELVTSEFTGRLRAITGQLENAKNENEELISKVAVLSRQKDNLERQVATAVDGMNEAKRDADLAREQRQATQSENKVYAYGKRPSGDYAAGTALGQQVKVSLASNEALGITSDREEILAGIRDAVLNSAHFSDYELGTALENKRKEVMAAGEKTIAYQKNLGEAAAAELRRNGKVSVADGGVLYRIDDEGKNVLDRSRPVILTVKEMLADGTVIKDMEVEKNTLTEKIENLPPVFTAALEHIKSGGKATILVPPGKAYGTDGLLPLIPPGATLKYVIKVLGNADRDK